MKFRFALLSAVLTLAACGNSVTMTRAEGEQFKGPHYRMAVGDSTNPWLSVKMAMFEYCNANESDCIPADKANATGAGPISLVAAPVINGAALVGFGAALRPAQTRIDDHSQVNASAPTNVAGSTGGNPVANSAGGTGNGGLGGAGGLGGVGGQGGRGGTGGNPVANGGTGTGGNATGVANPNVSAVGANDGNSNNQTVRQPVNQNF